MAEPFFFINTYAIEPGKEDQYREKFQEVAEIVETQEPKMLYFAEHVSEDASERTVVQVHADADNMVYHQRLVADHILEATQYLDLSTMSVRIYGTPGDAVLDPIRQLAGSGVSVTVSRPVVSINRLPSV